MPCVISGFNCLGHVKIFVFNFLRHINANVVLVLTAQKRHCALLLLPLLFSEPVEEWFVVNKVSICVGKGTM